MRNSKNVKTLYIYHNDGTQQEKRLYVKRIGKLLVKTKRNKVYCHYDKINIHPERWVYGQLLIWNYQERIQKNKSFVIPDSLILWNKHSYRELPIYLPLLKIARCLFYFYHKIVAGVNTE